MPTYRYKARRADGETGEGVVEASSAGAAVAQVRRSYEVVLDLQEIPAQRELPLAKFRRINLKMFALMCRQFSIILKAGLPLVQTVDLVASQMSDKTLRDLLSQVSEDIAGGWSLSRSFEKRGAGRLPQAFLETLRSGEESGDLAAAFSRLSTYYQRMTKTRSKAVSAMIYPAFLSVVAVIVIIIIMTYAVPAFARTFESLDIELPIFTRVVIGVSDFITHYGWALAALAALAILAWRLYGRTASGADRLAKAHLSLPVLGSLALMTSASQFAHTMSAMLSAGTPILRSLETSAQAVSNAHLSRQILDVLPGVEEGQPLGVCLRRCPDLPPMLVQMIAMGEATGTLESTLEIQAEYYDSEVETLTARALSLLEPIIIVVMALIVLVILLSIYVPLFTMYGAI